MQERLVQHAKAARNGYSFNGIIYGLNRPVKPATAGMELLDDSKMPEKKDEPKEIIHIDNGMGVACGGVKGDPWNWPEGHMRVRQMDGHKATCVACLKILGITNAKAEYDF